jgi:hypothetical protein
MGAYELSLILLSAIGFGLYVYRLFRLRRKNKAGSDSKAVKSRSRAAGA